MPLDWRETLRVLLGQFEARAQRSTGLHHLMVEVADAERDKMTGPSWFSPFDKKIEIVDGQPQFKKWDVTASRSLPGVSPGFREPKSTELTESGKPARAICDQNGVVRAVAVPMKLRQGYFAGRSSEEVAAFESIANVAAQALAGASDLQEHAFAAELTEIFRKPRGGVRYVFGEVPSACPNRFISEGWAAGVLQFASGVLIDVPIAENTPDAGHWLLLLHRLAWRRIASSGLRSQRNAWDGNVEVDFDMPARDWTEFPPEFVDQFNHISKESYYSVLGSKEAPLDVNLASVFAIQLLLAQLTSEISLQTATEVTVDYSSEHWHKRELPPIRIVAREEADAVIQPVVGLLVATDVERLAVLRAMRPPKGKRTVLQVHDGNNTCFLGRLGITDVVLCMTAMGSSGRDASTIVANEIIRSWKLRAVIMPGIAFGKDPVKQHLGNVLVSERIISYEPQRIGREATESRGSQHCSGAVLLNRFRNVLRWQFRDPNGRECGFQVGPILSGEKLVDNAQFKNSLFDDYPTAIGGEMEGVGVAASAERLGCEWIVAKAICDWGDGTKTKHHQEFAAASSVSLVEHVLNQQGVLESLT